MMSCQHPENPLHPPRHSFFFPFPFFECYVSGIMPLCWLFIHICLQGSSWAASPRRHIHSAPQAGSARWAFRQQHSLRWGCHVRRGMVSSSLASIHWGQEHFPGLTTKTDIQNVPWRVQCPPTVRRTAVQESFTSAGPLAILMAHLDCFCFTCNASPKF